MRRIRIVVAYDGTNYCGWQVQKNGETIESVLNLRRHVRIVECLFVGRLVRLPVIRREHMAARETAVAAGLIRGT